LQYILIEIIFVVTFPICCAMCFNGVGLSLLCILHYDYDDCFSTCG